LQFYSNYKRISALTVFPVFTEKAESNLVQQQCFLVTILTTNVVTDFILKELEV